MWYSASDVHADVVLTDVQMCLVSPIRSCDHMVRKDDTCIYKGTSSNQNGCQSENLSFGNQISLNIWNFNTNLDIVMSLFDGY